MKDLFIKNYKILVKDLKMKQINGNTSHIIRLEELIAEISILFKTTYRFNVIQILNMCRRPEDFFFSPRRDTGK